MAPRKTKRIGTAIQQAMKVAIKAEKKFIVWPGELPGWLWKRGPTEYCEYRRGALVPHSASARLFVLPSNAAVVLQLRRDSFQSPRLSWIARCVDLHLPVP